MPANDNGVGDGRGIMRGSYLNEDRPMTRGGGSRRCSRSGAPS